MKRNPFFVLLERVFSQKLWNAWRDAIAAAAVPGSGGVVFVGDSITHQARWDLMFPNVATRNFGISGERSEHLLLRLEPIVSIRPSQIFILIGTNDLAAKRTIDEIGADVGRVIERLQAALPDCRIHLQTVMPRAPKFAERVRALNVRYREIAARLGVELIDLFPAFEDGRGALRKELTYDAIHLLGQGYRQWQGVIAPYVGGAR